MELKKSLPHTLIEMTANEPRGAIKICGETLFSAVKDSTLAKRFFYDNMPVPEVDKLRGGTAYLWGIYNLLNFGPSCLTVGPSCLTVGPSWSKTVRPVCRKISM